MLYIHVGRLLYVDLKYTWSSADAIFTGHNSFSSRKEQDKSSSKTKQNNIEFPPNNFPMMFCWHDKVSLAPIFRKSKKGSLDLYHKSTTYLWSFFGSKQITVLASPLPLPLSSSLNATAAMAEFAKRPEVTVETMVRLGGRSTDGTDIVATWVSSNSPTGTWFYSIWEDFRFKIPMVGFFCSVAWLLWVTNPFAMIMINLHL
jgi:hypothetical protein